MSDDEEYVFDLPMDQLAVMLEDDGVLFVHSYNPVTQKHDDGFHISVNCSDLFDWACADAEPITWSDVPAVYAAWRADRLSRWCCLHRGSRPQSVIEKRWRERGEWDAELEALPSRLAPACAAGSEKAR